MASPKRVDDIRQREHDKFHDPDDDAGTIILTQTRDIEAAVTNNIKAIELLGLNFDDFVFAGDEIVSLNDGTLVKASL